MDLTYEDFACAWPFFEIAFQKSNKNVFRFCSFGKAGEYNKRIYHYSETIDSDCIGEIYIFAHELYHALVYKIRKNGTFFRIWNGGCKDPVKWDRIVWLWIHRHVGGFRQVHRTGLIKEELMTVMWHPDKVSKWLEAGFSVDEL